MNAVEAYIQFKPEAFADSGEVLDERTAEFLRDYMTEFRDFIARVLAVLPQE
jgi:chromate reductase